MRNTMAKNGFALAWVLGFISILSILMLAVAQSMSNTLRSTASLIEREQALNVAEAGINYYMWHLSHNPQDLTDGNGQMTPDPELGYGPFTHAHTDTNGERIGQFTLYLEPVTDQSSVTIVRSIGETDNTGITRTIEARIANPSFASWALAINTAVWFGPDETADGPIHSNTGVRMDGPNTDTVSSTLESYVPPSNLGGNGCDESYCPPSDKERPGVWCDWDVLSPTNCQTRSQADWEYPSQQINFNSLAADLCDLKKIALDDDSASCAVDYPQTNAYLPPVVNNYSSTRGYFIILNTNSTYDLYEITYVDDDNLTAPLYGYKLADDVALPSNGVLFSDENVWVESQSGGFDGRLTIAVARLSRGGEARAVITDDIRHEDYDNGNDAIGIIAEDKIDIAPYAGAPLDIEAALVAKEGGVRVRSVYDSRSNRSTPGYINANERLRFRGAIATNSIWTWTVIFPSHTAGQCVNYGSYCYSGYRVNETTYDERLLLNPPPHFPLTNSFDILEWREILISP